MTKRLNRIITLTVIGMSCMANASSAFAGNPEMDQLQQQVAQLVKQNEQLTLRISDMEKSLNSQQATDKTAQKNVERPEGKNKELIEEEVARQLKEKGGQKINDFVTLSGTIEGDMIFAKDYEGTRSSEFDLATVELVLDTKATEWAAGHIVVDYDGGDNENLYIDEANITLGMTDSFPLFMTAGKVYAPFGDFSTNMIQDPLTLTIGEINVPGVIGGFETNGIAGTLFGYKGMNETDADDTIKGFGASLAYSYEKDEIAINTGISWVNNIADSGGISDAFDEAGLDSISSQVSGLSIHLGVSYGAFSLIAEYTSALDSFDSAELAFATGCAEPSAWNSEIAYTSELWAKETVFAAGYQRSYEALALELPEQRFITAASIVIFNGTTLTLEYYLDKDYSLDDGGTGEDGYGFTTRLAYEF